MHDQTTTDMAKIDSRLPFFHLRHTNGPKPYKGQITKYIIQEDIDKKLSDYAPDVSMPDKTCSKLPETSSKLPETSTKLPVTKSTGNNEAANNTKTSTADVSKVNTQSNLKKPCTLPTQNSRLPSSMKPPATRLKKPITPPKPVAPSLPSEQGVGVASDLRKPAQSSQKSSQENVKSVQSSDMTKSTSCQKTAPAIAPKPVLSPNQRTKPSITAHSKISPPHSISKKYTHSASRPFSKDGLSGQSTSSKLAKSLAKSAGDTKSGNTSTPASQVVCNNTTVSRLTTPSKRVRPSNESLDSLVKTTSSSRLSPPKQTLLTKIRMKCKTTNNNNQETTTPRCFTDSTQDKQTPKLTPPSKICFGLKSNTVCKRTPLHPQVDPHKSVTKVVSVPIEESPIVPRVNIAQCIPSIHYCSSHLPAVCMSSQTKVVYKLPLYSHHDLYSVTKISAVQPASAVSSLVPLQFDYCEVSKVQSLYAPLKVISDDNEVFQVSPLTVNAAKTQCYTYLQQAQPSSYRKKLLNSFTVEEQLSPTAECYARHIANSIPQPWLSADIIASDSNVASTNLKLLIPEPPVQSSRTSKLQSIEEDGESSNDDGDTRKPPAPFSFSRNMPGESVDDLISLNKFSKPAVKPPSLLGNLFSKIGGRRILARPQESPPRVRKVLSCATKTGDVTRRKQSPRLQRKTAKNIRVTKSGEKSSPKHKPLIQEDSPIRCKEAYYGGDHQHMLKPIDGATDYTKALNNESSRPQTFSSSTLTFSSKGSRPILSLKEHNNHQLSQVQGSSETPENSSLQCATPINAVSERCRDDHMRFYTYGGDRYSTIGSSSCRGRCSSHTPAQMSNVVMSRSLNSRKKLKGSVDDGSRYTVTHYAPILGMGLPPCPPFLNDHIEQGNSALSKVSVAVRLKQSGETNTNVANSYITADPSRAQLVLRDPSNESNMAPSCRRQLAAVPKFFAFDTVFSSDAMQMDVCKGSVLEILQSVLQGSDGCVASFGQSKTGKSRSLIGVDSSCADFGIIPTAISWLYHLIDEHKVKTGARFSIRVTALEIRGKNEELTDLLAGCTPGQDGTAADQIQLTSTPVYGAQLENLHELRSPNAAQAGYYLDSALTAAHNLDESSEAKGAHFLFTLHIYQHHVETKPSPGGALVAGGRSRLHFVDIGPCAKSSSDGSALTLAALGSTITALLNGQRNFPQKESKLATLLKDSVGHSNCRTCILVHISTQPSQYSETLPILQLAARIHRMKVRRRNKISSNSSDDTGSTSSNLRRRRGIRMGTSSSLSDPDVSSSEQSVDTVIYVPGNKHRHAHHSPAVYRTNPSVSKHRSHHQMGPTSEAPKLNGALPYTGSPYNAPGAIKKRLSDDETSSEGRRRMPRTNVRVWPKANQSENEMVNQTEYWLDAPPAASRDQWHIPGNANPLPQPHNNPAPYCSPQSEQHPASYHYQHQQPPHNDFNSHNHYSAVRPDPSTPWMSLAQYNGHPGQIGHATQVAPARQAWVDPGTEQRGGGGNEAEVAKQELWVDGPTAFRKNIEGLTSNLHKDQLSPTKKHHRHHSSGDRTKHHHRTPNRKYREAHKHCHQCGADIKKDLKGEPIPKSEEPKTTQSQSQSLTEEPSINIKPFVKDWVIRHSKNNTPNKAAEDSEFKSSPNKGDQQVDSQTRADMLERELHEQDNMQLTVDLAVCSDEQLTNLSNLPCSDNFTDDFDHQDTVQVDDSVSNVTADDRVGFESKEGSLFDENSLSEEVVEVCDAACQTEFTDSDTHSIQSNTPQSDLNIETEPDNAIVRTATHSIGRRFSKHDSTEAFLNATLQGSMSRKPDGASDPSLHKELLSPVAERKQTDSLMQVKYHSNTLPRNTHLVAPQSLLKQTDHSTNEQFHTIKLQPYLSSCKQTPLLHHPTSSTLPKRQNSPKTAKLATDKLVPEPVPAKLESKIKKPSLFKQLSNDSSQDSSNKTAGSSPGKKNKSSKLPSIRLSGKPKESKTPTSSPSSPAKKSESSKKEKKSLLQPPAIWKSSNKSTSKSSAPSSSTKSNSTFDVTSSPYRHYVLPKPSYSYSDGCSDNSSCPSHTLACHKYSVSSGYDSMTMNSAEDIPEATKNNTLKVKAENSAADPWLSSTSKTNGRCKELDRMHQRRYDENQLSENVTRQAQIEDLLYKQDLLKREMAEAKSRLMVPVTVWNYESTTPTMQIPPLHVASQIDRRNDDGYLEALEKETNILQKRVDACKSRIMLVTSII